MQPMKSILAMGGIAASLAACSTTAPTAIAPSEPMIAAVSPAAGAVAASRAGAVSVSFRHPMGRTDLGTMGAGSLAHSMEMVISLHQGAVTTPAIAGTAAWSADRSVLTFTPAAPLAPATNYVIFLGGRMTTADGRILTESECMAASGMMGSGGTMGSGMMSGGAGGKGAGVHHEMDGTTATGMGMAGSSGMMGGVTRPDGVHGMTFGFTTGS